MILIKEMTEEDSARYSMCFLHAFDYFGDFDGEFYKVIIDGDENILHVRNNVFTLYKKDEKEIKALMFSSNSEYQLKQVAFEDFDISFSVGWVLKESKTNSDVESINIVNIEEEGFKGRLIYIQYNEATDERIMFYYDKRYNGKQRIYDVGNPYCIVFQPKYGKCMDRDKECKEKIYFKKEIDYENEPGLFNIITIKDFGIGKFLGNRAVDLQDSERIIRFCKIGENGTPSVFGNHYCLEDMEEIIKEKGFNLEIPKVLISIYNGDNKRVKLCNDVLRAYKKKIDLDYAKLSLKRRVD